MTLLLDGFILVSNSHNVRSCLPTQTRHSNRVRRAMAQWELVVHMMDWMRRKVAVDGPELSNLEFDLVKWLLREVLSHLGIWASAWPLADLAVFLEGVQLGLAQPGKTCCPFRTAR